MNNCDGGHNKYLMDSGFLPLIFIVGRLGFVSTDVVLVSMFMICIRMVTISNMYIVNK